jgi:hypothetical protein
MKQLKLIIAGSRNFYNYILLESTLAKLLSKYDDLPKQIEVVSGHALGADRLGEIWAERHAIKVTTFPANWQLHGKRAGYLRNIEMAEYADALVAFWDGMSKGTKHMIDIAKSKNLQVRVIKFESRLTL